MPMNMEIPAMPTPRPAKPKAKVEKAAQGREEDFRTALKDEKLKQAKGSETEKASEKRQEKPEDDPRQDTDQAVAAGGASSPAKPGEKPDSKEKIEGTATPGSKIAVQATPAETVQSPPDVKGEIPKSGTTSRPADETAQSISAKGAGGQQPVNPGAGSSESGKTVEATGKAAPPQTGEPKLGKTETVELKSGESPVLEQATAKADSPVPKPLVLDGTLQKQPNPQEPKTKQAGLMDASFSGLLNPEVNRNPAGKGNPIHATRQEDGALPFGQEIAPAADNGRAVAIEQAEADLSEALLKHPEEPSGSLEDMKFRQTADKGQPSLFDHTLASTGSGKPELTGQTTPLQSTAQAMTSATGSLNEEVRVMDQVLTQLPLNRLGEKNRVVIRLHPEELGEVKLDLVMDKDQLKAHVVTQTQQVQSILEKHLPRLQEALQNQGIKLDQVEVSVDSQANQGREFSGREQQQSTPWAGPFGPQTAVPEPAQVAAAANQARTTQGGLSLRI